MKKFESQSPGPAGIDPVCNMSVELAEARTRGLAATHAGRVYGFCSTGCQKSFLADPAKYTVA